MADPISIKDSVSSLNNMTLLIRNLLQSLLLKATMYSYTLHTGKLLNQWHLHYE